MTAGTSGSSAPQVDSLLTLLERQRDLYQQLVDLPMPELLPADSDDDGSQFAGQWKNILSQRQALIERLTRGNQAIRQSRDTVKNLSGPSRDQVQQLTAAVAQLHDTILARDGQWIVQLQQAKTRTAEELERLTRGGTAAHAYQQSPVLPSGGRFMDQRG